MVTDKPEDAYERRQRLSTEGLKHFAGLTTTAMLTGMLTERAGKTAAEAAEMATAMVDEFGYQAMAALVVTAKLQQMNHGN